MAGEEEIQRGIFFHVTDFFLNFFSSHLNTLANPVFPFEKNSYSTVISAA